MTLGEGKRKVYQLLDEYTSGGTVTVDPDIEKKMIDFFDLAQKDVAQAKKIFRVVSYCLKHGTGEILYRDKTSKYITRYSWAPYIEYLDADGTDERVLLELPESLFEICSVKRDGRRTTDYDVTAGMLEVKRSKDQSVELEYAAMPATIPEGAEDDYEFEVAEDAAACMPYYVAAQVLLPDLVLDYSPYWQMYLTRRAALMPTVRHGGGGGIRQTLFRR